jgi:hypothetical protein
MAKKITNEPFIHNEVEVIAIRHLVGLARDCIGRAENKEKYDQVLAEMPLNVMIETKKLPMNGPLTYNVTTAYLDKFHEFKFHKRFDCRIDMDEGTWEMHTPLCWVSSDASMGELFDKLIIELRMIWDNYATKDSKDLSVKDKEFKRKCLSLMQKVGATSELNKTTNVQGNTREG